MIKKPIITATTTAVAAVTTSSLSKLARAFYSRLMDNPFQQITGTCRSIIFNQHGDPSTVLKMKDGYVMQDEDLSSSVSTREGTKGLVLIKMLAAPVNPADINQIQGTYPLQSPGYNWHVAGNEGVGQITQVGKDVDAFQVGDWVIPNIGALGTWREQLVAQATDLQKIPNDLSLEVAASLLVNPPTAYRMLRDFVNLQPGDVIIQNGANSAVGRYIIQMAALQGIRTINIIRDRVAFETLEKELLSLGATAVVKAERFALPSTQEYLINRHGRPILGLNCVSGIATIDMANILAEGSPLVTYGGMSRKSPMTSTASLIFKDIKYAGFWMSRWYAKAREDSLLAAEQTEMINHIIEMFRNNQLAPSNFEKFDFALDWSKAVDHYTMDQSVKQSIAKPLLVMHK